MNRQSSELPQNKQSISTWVLANTQVAQSLVQAWDDFYQQATQDDPEWIGKRLEIERRVGEVLEKAWLDHADEERKREEKAKQNPVGFTADCTSYNIHQEVNRELELQDVTLWRLSLKNFKLNEKPTDRVQIQALEYNTKSKQFSKQKKKN